MALVGCDYPRHSALYLRPNHSRADIQYNSTPSCVILLLECSLQPNMAGDMWMWIYTY